jgi:hypothetical protein
MTVMPRRFFWGSGPWKVPFGSPYLWRVSFLFWPAGPFVAAFPGIPKVNTVQPALPHLAVSTLPAERGRQVTLGINTVH